MLLSCAHCPVWVTQEGCPQHWGFRDTGLCRVMTAVHPNVPKCTFSSGSITTCDGYGDLWDGPGHLGSGLLEVVFSWPRWPRTVFPEVLKVWGKTGLGWRKKARQGWAVGETPNFLSKYPVSCFDLHTRLQCQIFFDENLQVLFL